MAATRCKFCTKFHGSLRVRNKHTSCVRQHQWQCRQAEELKQLVDEASQFHLGRQRQHSAVICSRALLFSSSVLHPSLVMLCSHKSGRCAVGGSILESTEGHGRGVERRVPEMIRMSHIVESLPLTKLNDGLSRLHSADEDAVSWLTSYGSWHAYEKKWQCHRSVSGLASFSVNFSSKMTIILRTPLMPAVTKVVKLKMPFTVASMRSCKYIPYHLPYCILHDMGGICPKFGVIELAINAVLWTL